MKPNRASRLKKTWTEVQDNILRSVWATGGPQAILDDYSSLFRCCRTTLKLRARELGLPPSKRLGRGSAWTAEQIKYLRDNWATDTASGIGKALGKTRTAVIGKAHKLGVPKRLPSWRPGDAVPDRLKLTKFLGVQ